MFDFVIRLFKDEMKRRGIKRHASKEAEKKAKKKMAQVTEKIKNQEKQHEDFPSDMKINECMQYFSREQQEFLGLRLQGLYKSEAFDKMRIPNKNRKKFMSELEKAGEILKNDKILP